MYCGKCGKELPDGSSMCTSCGYVFGAPQQSAPPQPQQQNVPPQQPYQAYQPQPGYQPPQGYQPPYGAYRAPTPRKIKKTEKLLVSVFKNMSFVTLGVFIAGCVTTLFTLITMITSLFWGNVFANLISGLASTAYYAMITVFLTVMLAKIDYKEETKE